MSGTASEEPAINVFMVQEMWIRVEPTVWMQLRWSPENKFSDPPITQKGGTGTDSSEGPLRQQGSSQGFI